MIGPFFGLTDDYQIRLHELISELGKTYNFTHDDWYSMPIQLRTFYARKAVRDNEQEKEKLESARAQAEASQNRSSQFPRGPAVDRR